MEGQLAAGILGAVDGVGGEIAPRDCRWMVDWFAADSGVESLKFVHIAKIIPEGMEEQPGQSSGRAPQNRDAMQL